MKAAIYCRVSTTMQEDSNSLENQISRCKQYCDFRGFEIDKVYTDVETGINDSRPAFLDIQKAAANKEFDVIIVTELQRLSRKLTTLLAFVIELENHNVNFISISQNFDTTSAIGRAMLKLIGVFAEFEREQTSERVSNTLKALAVSGKWKGGKVPYGYRFVNGNLEICESEAINIRKMFQMFLEGNSRVKIAAYFGLHRTVVDKRLINVIYSGNIQHGKSKNNVVTGKYTKLDNFQVYTGQHEAIVDESTFQKVQNIIQNAFNKRDYGKEYLLSGLITCFCGRQMYGSTTTSYGKTYQYYVCRKNPGDENKCKHNISAKDFETEIIDILKDFIKHPNHLKKYIHSGEKKVVKVDVEKLKRLKLEAEKKKEALIDLLLENLITKDQYKTREMKLVVDIQNYENEIESYSMKQDTLKNKNIVENLFMENIKHLDTKDVFQLKLRLKSAIDNIIFISDSNYKIDFNV